MLNNDKQLVGGSLYLLNDSGEYYDVCEKRVEIEFKDIEISLNCEDNYEDIYEEV